MKFSFAFLAILFTSLLFVASFGTCAPIVTHTPPTNVGMSGPIPIKITVNSNGSIVNAVYLHYESVGDSVYLPHTMRNVGNGVWDYQIPQQTSPGNVYYFFEIEYTNNNGTYRFLVENYATAYNIEVHQGNLPYPPRNLTATAGNGQVTLFWNLPTFDGGTTISKYTIYRGTSADGETLLTTISNDLNYTDTSVTNNQTYYYKVSAVNSVGLGNKSNEVSATPTAPPEPINTLPPWLFPLTSIIIIIAVFGVVTFLFIRSRKTPKAPTGWRDPPQQSPPGTL